MYLHGNQWALYSGQLGETLWFMSQSILCFHDVSGHRYFPLKRFPLHAVTNCHANPRNKDTSQIFCHSSVWFPTWYSWCFVYTVPRVSIEEEVVDFGSMSVGQSATAVLHVRNDSDVTTLFQVYTWSYSCIHTHCCSCIFNDTCRSMQQGLWKLYNNYV